MDDQLEIRIKPRILRMETCVAAMQGHYPDKREMHPPLPERKARRGCKLCEWLGFSSRKPTEEPKRPSANKLIPKDESLRKCWRDRDAFMMNEELPVIAEAVPEALADALDANQKHSALAGRRDLAGSVQVKGTISGIEKTVSAATTTITSKDITNSVLPDLGLIGKGAKSGLSECRQLLRASEAILKAVEKDMEKEKRND